MSAHACCTVNVAGDRSAAQREKAGSTRRGGLARAGTLGSWIGPSALLVLLPKCPMCLAGYLALAGIGVSVPVAAGLRVGLLAAASATVGLMVGRLASHLTQ